MLARLTSLVLAFAVLASSGTASATLYQCRFSGDVHRSCCCYDDEDDAQTAPSIEAEPCCDAKVLSVEPEAAVVTTGKQATQLDPPTLAVGAPTSFAGSTATTSVVSRGPRAPPPAACPLYTRHCAFLI